MFLFSLNEQSWFSIVAVSFFLWLKWELNKSMRVNFFWYECRFLRSLSLFQKEFLVDRLYSYDCPLWTAEYYYYYMYIYVLLQKEAFTIVTKLQIIFPADCCYRRF